MLNSENERLRRWRLILGGEEADGIGQSLLSGDEGIDRTLSALYDADDAGEGRGTSRRGGLGSSAPNVARWLGDIRAVFPVLSGEGHAAGRAGAPEPARDVATTRDAGSRGAGCAPGRQPAWRCARHSRTRPKIPRGWWCGGWWKKWSGAWPNPLRQAVTGSLNRAARNRRPRHNEIDWHRTIRANLKHYQPEYRTIIPETRIGYGHKRSALREIILCIDQSGSMGTSVVYSGIFGAVLASLPSIQTRLVAFDTAVVDLTEELNDPVDIAFRRAAGRRHRHQSSAGLLSEA